MMKKNILFIFTDQFRWDALGCVGGWVKTPNLDRLAAQGIRFNNCLTNSPVCVPARVSLATGLYPHNHGIWFNDNPNVTEETKTWMAAIRDAGYRTALFGKTHLHPHEGNLRDREPLMHALGFDVVNEIGGPRTSMHVGSYMTEEWERLGLWDDYRKDYEERFANKAFVARPSTLPLEHYADVYVGRKAGEYLRNYDEPSPWFCMVSFGGPHEPWDTPEPYASMYDPEDMPLPIPRPKLREERTRGKLDEWMSERRHSPDMTPREIAELRANYAGNVTLIDEQIGKIIEIVKERGEWENTIVLFASDHGEMNGDYGLIYKENMLNSAVKIPLIVRAPEIISGEAACTVYEGMAELMDIGPTLCELAGASISYKQFGRSLVPVIGGTGGKHREFALSEVHGERLWQSESWKLVLNKLGEPYLLFDLKNDPHELENLAGLEEYKEITNRLMDSMNAYLTETA